MHTVLQYAAITHKKKLMIPKVGVEIQWKYTTYVFMPLKDITGDKQKEGHIWNTLSDCINGHRMFLLLGSAAGAMASKEAPKVIQGQKETGGCGGFDFVWGTASESGFSSCSQRPFQDEQLQDGPLIEKTDLLWSQLENQQVCIYWPEPLREVMTVLGPDYFSEIQKVTQGMNSLSGSQFLLH